MISINMISPRMGTVSDNALLPCILRRNVFFGLLTNQSTSIMLSRHCADSENLLNTTPTASNQCPPADSYVKSVGLSTPADPASASLSIACGEVSDPFVARVLARLSEAEWKSPLGSRDDIRVAWITVLKADEGHPTPFAQAFFQYFGVSPEKMIPFLSARAELDRIYAQSQAAWLEKYLPFRHHDGWRETFARIQADIDSAALPPKKPAASVPAIEIMGVA